MNKNYKIVWGSCAFIFYTMCDVDIVKDRKPLSDRTIDDHDKPVLSDFYVPKTEQHPKKIELQTQKMQVNALDQAQDLIRKSYFSPEMQYSVLALFDRPFIIDHTTGVVKDLPTIEAIMAQIDAIQAHNLKISDASVRKLAQERMQSCIVQALQEMLQAVEIAMFIVYLQAAYADTQVLFVTKVDPILDFHLHLYKEKIEAKLQEMHPSQSWQSWWFADATPVHSKPENIQQIIMNNSYKHIKNDATGKMAANLLFKQCFVSLQEFTKFMPFLNRYLLLDFTNSMNLYATVPDIDRCIMMLHNAADALVNNSAKMEELAKIHQIVLAVRQAVQVALFIANKNSFINYGHRLPASVTRLLDSVVQRLLEYDQKLDSMCKDQLLGATKDDFYRDKVWSAISSIACGAALLGIGAAVYYDAAGVRSAVVPEQHMQAMRDLVNNPVSQTVKIYSNAGVRKLAEWYKASHEQAVPGKSFWEPETWESLSGLTNYVTRDVAPIVHNALTAKGEWTDPEAKEKAEQVKADLGTILSTGIKSGVKHEAVTAVKKVVAPLTSAISKVDLNGYAPDQSDPLQAL
jgi:hypothetical protein